MLKEVGASGQISLGKKYAGQLFDMQIAEDGSVKLTPVKVVPVAMAAQEERAVYQATAAPSNALGDTREWADAHATQIDQYNNWVTQRKPYSQRVREWREQGSSTSPDSGNS